MQSASPGRCGMMDVPTLVVFVSTAVALLVLSEQRHLRRTRDCDALSNSVKFLIAVLALRKQMLRFVQVTLLGSVLFGSLLVPGVSFIARGIKHLSHLKQKHNKHAAGMHSMVLLLAAFSYGAHNAAPPPPSPPSPPPPSPHTTIATLQPTSSGVPAAYNATSAAYGRCRTYCYDKHMLPLSRLVAAVRGRPQRALSARPALMTRPRGLRRCCCLATR